MVPPDPARFSTMNRLPNSVPMVSASRRVIVSPVPPAARGTMILTGALGQPSCARAGTAITIGAANRDRRDTRTVIQPFPPNSCSYGAS